MSSGSEKTREGTQPNSAAFSFRLELFSEHLEKQIDQMKMIDAAIRALCSYLIGCLNYAGYLDGSLSELANELHAVHSNWSRLFDVVQNLDPPAACKTIGLWCK
ncbi:MAG: hypothetical protein LKJ86_06410 [Oscillibacter sp.]|jgi:RNA polymerase sigma-54 factor|nr:hypothetical protein [Oscillibacter sp.]